MIQKYKNVFFLIIVVLLIVTPFFLLPGTEFAGTDDLAGEGIEELDPSYEPWFQPLWEPGSDTAEKLIFAFQAALGSAFIIYYFRTKKKRKAE
ncbi:MAG: energy-coupling factor ABC transporter substrate-binding protein [Bacillota bacterium]|nr:energy-coupling factor ABC transporter substrate-binding protein [Bacillota bacterium]MDW7684226.1 energy-coupling factor ABC transporter substrate-binding protein [Bacillota bacterium]